MLRYVIIAVAVSLVTAVCCAMVLRNWWGSPLATPAGGLVVTVEPGDSLSRISRRLGAAGVLHQPRLLNLAGRLLQVDSRIRPGEYRLPKGTNPETLLALLQSGDTIRYLVTLPEGITLSAALSLIQASEGVRRVLSGADDPQLLALVAPRKTTEGYFLPETYQYERGDSDLQLLTESHRLMEKNLAHAWSQRQSDLPYVEPYEALIMASIIEKETGLASERSAIGGVFVRRLRRGMRLQTDPTVIYGLGEAFDGNLTRKHLNDESNPYNSYRHNGLPPGPIALPGKAALMAAVKPEAGDALYFVAKGDGSHQFSATLKEHETAVRQFQLSRPANYRSSPEMRQQ